MGRLLLLAALALAAGINTLWFGFAYDDDLWIVYNPLVRGLRNVPQFFAAGQNNGVVYRPFTALSFALDYAVAGLNAWFYHLENALLHVAVTLLLYLLLRRVARSAAWLGALLFAVLPVHSEVIANVTSRSELLAAAFALTALLLFEAGARGRLRFYAYVPLSGLAMFAAMLSKESAAAVPALAVLLWWRQPDRQGAGNNAGGLDRRGNAARDWRRVIPALAAFALAIGVYFVLRHHAACCTLFPGSSVLNAQLDNPLFGIPWVPRVRTALAILGRNFVLCFFPYHLAADYSYPQIEVVRSRASESFLAWTAVLVAAVGLAAAARRRHPNMTCGILWFLLALLPASNLLIAIGTIRAERLLYLPSAGVCLLVAESLLLVVAARRRMGAVLIGVLVCGYAVASISRNAVWHDMNTLAAATARDSPRSARAQFNLAIVHARVGDCPGAIPSFQRALDLYPQFELARVKLASCYRDMGELREAERNFRVAFEQNRKNREAAESLAELCAQRGDAACVAEARRSLTP